MDNSPARNKNNNIEGLQPSLLGTSTPFSASTVDHEGPEEMEQHFHDVLNEMVMNGGSQLDLSLLGNDAGYISGNFGDLDLGRLFLAYKQLDARVARLEAHILHHQTSGHGRSSMKRQYSKPLINGD
jgi:hypothetical protein